MAIDRNRSAKGKTNAAGDAERSYTPGKHSNTEMLGEGGAGPIPNVPGKRSATEFLPEAGGSYDQEPSGARSALAEMAHAFRHSFDDVRIHTGKHAHEKARGLGTQAVTIGRDIYFAEGAFDPGSQDGKRVLAHELTHVVQQRQVSARAQTFTVGERGDAFELEAHHAADSVLAGRAPTIQQSTSSAVAMRDEEAPPKVDRKAYLKKNQAEIATKTGAALLGLDIDPQCVFTTWKTGSAVVLDLVAKELANDAARFVAELSVWCAPESPDAAIDRGRGADADGKSDEYFMPAVATELRNLLVRRLTESVKRLMPRYAQATNTAFGKLLGPVDKPDINNPPVPPADTVIPGGPLDKYVARAMMGQVKVDLKNYQAAHPNEKPVTKPRQVQYSFAATAASSASEGKLNWVQVTSECDPPVTAEDVALSIYGKPEMASLLTPAAPLWGFQHPELLLRYEDWKKLPGNTGESDPNNDKYNPDKADPAKQILGAPDADKAVLDQAKGTGGTGKGTKEVVAARMKSMMVVVDGITADIKSIGLDTSGLASLRQRLDDRAKKVLATQVNADGQQNEWDGQSAQQLEILGACATGTQVAASNWSTLIGGATDKKDSPAAFVAEPVKKLARAYLEAAAVSDLIETAHGRLGTAQETYRNYPVDVLEGILSYVRQLMASVWTINGSFDAQGTTGKSGGNLSKKEEELRGRLATLRETIVKNPAVASQEIKKIQEEVTELQIYASVYALVDQGGDLQNTLYFLGKSFGADKDWSKLWHPLDESKRSGSKKQKYEKASGEIYQLKYEIEDKVMKPAKAGDMKTAGANLPAIQASYKAKFQSVAELIDKEETREKWIKIGVLIGAGIMTAGFAEGVAAVAATDLGMSGAGLAAVKVGAEATAFTTITQTTLETDHDIKSVTMAFFQNLATFAMVGKAMEAYKAAFPQFAETFKGQVVGAGGMFVAHCSAGVAAADAKKYLATGEHLTEHEIHDAVEEGVLVTIGTLIGERLTHTFLHGLHLTSGKHKTDIDNINSRRDATKAKADALKAGGKIQNADAVVKDDSANIQAEKQKLDELDSVAKDPAKAKAEGWNEADVNLIKNAKGTADVADAQNKLLQLLSGLRHLGGGNFVAEGEAQFNAMIEAHRQAGNEVQVSEPDPVTKNRVATIKTKGESPQTIRIIEDTQGGVTAKPEQRLPTPAEQKGLAAAAELRRREQAYRDSKAAITGQMKRGATGDDFTLDETTASLPEIIQKMRELGWQTMEVVDGDEVTLPDGSKTKLRKVRFEAHPDPAGEKPPFEDGVKVMRVTEAKPPKPKAAVTPEQWKAVKDAIHARRTPSALDLPQTPGNLEGTVKLEKLNRDAWLQSDPEGQGLVAQFYSELTKALDAMKDTPPENLNDVIQKIMDRRGTDGKPVYLMKGPPITRAEAETFGGLYRGVNYTDLAGNKCLTQSYYERLLAHPDVDPAWKLPAKVQDIDYGQHARHIGGLMKKLPPNPDVDLNPMAPVGRGNAPGWWGSGSDPGVPSPAPPTMDAKTYAQAVAAINLEGGGVLFRLEAEQITGGGKDMTGKPIVARRPTMFDALWQNQFNPNPDAGANFGKTTPDPTDPKTKAVREVIMPTVGIGQAKTRILLQ